MFWVETDEPDREVMEIFDDDTPYPYLVDLDSDEFPSGECDCRDFRFNVKPFIEEQGRKECIHIIKCRRYRALLGGIKPKPMPNQLIWKQTSSQESPTDHHKSSTPPSQPPVNQLSEAQPAKTM